ncbi:MULTISPECIES: metal-sulfur cluster assembly factor [Cupriavidus]|uniref:metal-sulfur cluster assembly factor n=1 Tax=Cupriavidus TaxID=106589 RepID=UPI00036F3F6B|nr:MULTISPECIES: metal-sulfur cluster assembly factor [Cupriavidus]
MPLEQAWNATGGFDYQGPQEWLAPITEALRRVVDPELALNILDVGLVYAVAVSEGVVKVTMTMTSAACPVADMILDDVQFELEDTMPLGYAIELELCWEPAWSPERMSAAARRVMGW